MDDVAVYNQVRWQALADANALFTRPALDLDAAVARARVDPDGLLGDLAGQDVLCLAAGGGQQSAAFGVLGARVTVVDLAAAQLERDRQAAAHYGLDINTVQADMRDLSALDTGAYDLVWHGYSLNFVPDPRVVFGDVARVLRPGGHYSLMCANPLVLGLNPRAWSGQGYLLSRPFRGGELLDTEDETWVFRERPPADVTIPAPREYRHTLSTLVAGLSERGFIIRQLSDSPAVWPDPNAKPGTWDHFVAIAPPWLAFWCEYQPASLRV
jgi:SAM-dependent methyltransferase